MCSRLRIRLALAASLLFPAWAFAQVNLTPNAATTSNVVTGTIIHDTWDPGDTLTISGDLHNPQPGGECSLGALVKDAETATITIMTAVNGQPGHAFCPGTKVAVFTPGTNGSGRFSLRSPGGGVSWLVGPGADPVTGAILGSWMRITFTKGTQAYLVDCGSHNRYPAGFACEDAPHIYGVLASPDLLPNGFVDQVDLVAFVNLYFGQTITADVGWQADFNHDGHPTVDAADLAYFVGRLNHNCVQGKPTATTAATYAMDVHNLEVEYVKATLQSLVVTNAQIIGAWDQMGLSYDHEAAATLLRKPVAAEVKSWSLVKSLYR